MATRKAPPVLVPYQAHTCAMPGCDRPAHMYCSDGHYYCCLNCQMALPEPPHDSVCEASARHHALHQPEKGAAL